MYFHILAGDDKAIRIIFLQKRPKIERLFFRKDRQQDAGIFFTVTAASCPFRHTPLDMPEYLLLHSIFFS